MTRHTGRCLCGDVSFEVTAEPLFAGFCHCLDCQKASGGGRTSVTAFPAAAVAVKGKTETYGSLADSGATMTRHFCPRCGSRLFAQSSQMPEVFAIAVSAFDDLTFFKPMASMFAKRRRPWDALTEGIPAFEGMPPRN